MRGLRKQSPSFLAKHLWLKLSRVMRERFYSLLALIHPYRKGCGVCEHRIRPLGSRLLGVPEPDFPVDIVITWVDGNDPKHKTKCLEYFTKWRPGRKVEAGRFRDNGELRFSMRSLENFAPWIRRVYLVTDGQHPAWLNLEHPKITIVDHKDFIPSEYLPTFNSHVIESFLHRLPGLAEHYVYLNDDVFLARPTVKSDFFSANGIPYCFIDWRLLRQFGYESSDTPHSASWHNTVRFLKKHGVIAPKERPFISAHGPFPQTKTNAKIAAEFYKDVITKFATNRFRTKKEMAFYSHAAPLLFYAKRRIIPCDERYFYIQNRQIDRRIYYSSLLNSRDMKAPPLFFCINDTGEKELNPAWKRDLLWILHRYFPQAVSFENTGQGL